jgi:5-hydroxyisourate hydrolase-like protein (transthyretin family)
MEARMNRVSAVVCLIATSLSLRAAPAGANGRETSAPQPVIIQVGGISGTVTDAVTHAPLAQVTVQAVTANFQQAVQTTTDAAGAYALAGLAAGEWFVRAFGTGDYLGQVFEGAPCHATCNLSDGTPLTVVDGATITGVNLALSKGGRIAGHVIDQQTGLPLANASVRIDDAGGTTAGFGFTNAAGDYIAGPIPAGTHFATVFRTGYVAETFDGIHCFVDCLPHLQGTPILVMASQTVPDINFAMDAAGSITGTIVNAATLTPLSGVRVRVLSAGGQTVSSTQTNAQGQYTAGGLDAGMYLVKTDTAGYINEVFDNEACPPCRAARDGTPVEVTLGSITPAIDFALEPGGGISGTVVDEATNLPLANVFVSVFRETGHAAGGVATDASGAFRIGGLGAGTYFASARGSSTSDYVLEGFGGMHCTELVFPNFVGQDDDPITRRCTPVLGDPITVAMGTDTGGINFALNVGATIQGGVVAADTLQALAQVGVIVLNDQGGMVAMEFTRSDGTYAIRRLPPGAYYVKILGGDPDGNATTYIPELFDDVPCLNSCDLLQGELVTASAGAATQVDFALTRGGQIAGRVTDSITGLGIGQNVFIEVYDASGARVSTGITDDDGRYTTFSGLPTGTYFARTRFSQGHLNEAYNNIACAACDPTLGSPISVVAGATTGGIDFVLDRGGRLSGWLVDATSGAGILGHVEVFDAAGRLVTTAKTNLEGGYIVDDGLPNGEYFAVTSNMLGYGEQLFEGLPCSGCNPTLGTPIAVESTSITAGVDFNLSKGGGLEGVVRDASTSAPIAGVVVQVYDSTGDLVGASATDSAGRYAIAGISPGPHYARTSNAQGFVDSLYPGIPCEPACDVLSGAPINIATGTVAAVDFALSAGGVFVVWPSGNPVWSAGSMQPIVWLHNVRRGSLFTIEASRDGGLTFPEIIASNVAAVSDTTGYFVWRVNGPGTSQARVRVVWQEGLTVRHSTGDFRITTPTISVTGPPSAANWGYGTTQLVTWSTNLPGSETVDVLLSVDGGASFPIVVASSIPAAAGAAGVTVPALAAATTQARLRVVWSPDRTVGATSPSNFQVSPPFITLLYPTVSGHTWTVGTVTGVLWNNNLGLLELVRVELSLDGGATYPVTLAPTISALGWQLLFVQPAWVTAAARVRVTWLRDNSVISVSSQGFAIR